MVNPGEPAEKGGLKSGDVILEFNGKKIKDVKSLQRTVAESVVESKAEVKVWRDKKTKGVFWRGVPNKVFSPELHESVTSTVEENVNNMKRIADLIHQTCGEDKHIIYTLSPVPLAATFQNRPTMVSDCVSKSILRVALDEYFRKHNPKNVYYWPSFEMVRWVGPHTEIPTLFEDNTTRHVNNSIVSIIIDNFVKAFFKN